MTMRSAAVNQIDIHNLIVLIDKRPPLILVQASFEGVNLKLGL